jgi:hypothetical protein
MGSDTMPIKMVVSSPATPNPQSLWANGILHGPIAYLLPNDEVSQTQDGAMEYATGMTGGE